MIDETETWARDRAIYNGILESIAIIDDKSNKGKGKGDIPEILSDALSVCLDEHVGHNYIEDAVERWEYYKKKDKKIPFDLEYMNNITDGGLSNKTLNVIMAETGGGKSLLMCHMAAANLSIGMNVLYITMEMAEEKIAKRIDANLLDIPMGEIETIGEDIFTKRINKLKKKGIGKLIIKEYPISCAGAAHFRYLLKELSIKKGFKPDIVYVDYLNICCSTRIKQGSENSYGYVKSIAEELRGFGQENDFPLVSASQLNRAGYGSDPGLTNTSESMGLPFTADNMWAIIRSEDMDKLGQVLIKQLKNRDGDLSTHRTGLLGLDIQKMRFHDLPGNAYSPKPNSHSPTSPPTNSPNMGSAGKKDFSKFKF